MMETVTCLLELDSWIMSLSSFKVLFRILFEIEFLLLNKLYCIPSPFCSLPSSHHRCFLTHPTSYCLYLGLSLHDLNSQASSHLLLSLRLFLSLARCSYVELQANVCAAQGVLSVSVSVSACVCVVLWIMFVVCVCMCVCKTFLSPLSVLTSHGALSPILFLSPHSLPFLCLFTTCVCLSHQVYFVLS